MVFKINFEEIDSSTYDLSVKNPNIEEEKDERTPSEIILEIEKLDKENLEILKNIKKLI